MKPARLCLAAAAVTLGACATYSSAPSRFGPVAVTSATKPPYGPYLVDGSGRSLYLLEGTRGTAAERCNGDCLRVWPPVHVTAPPIAGRGIDPTRLSTRVAHGHTHVTYGDWTLFYYHRDRGPGDTTGQYVRDAWGTWYLVSPSGEPVRPSAGY